MKIALVGYEVEGQASYRYFKDKADEIVIFDEADTPGAAVPDGVKTLTGDTALTTLKSMQFDKVVRTPKLSPYKLEGVKNVTTATKEFFAYCPAPIIGVTGTKGKGTTCSLIAKILQAAGKTIWLVGNIGAPALDVLAKIKPSDIVVYELSSFQLWDLNQSPHVAVVLMIESDHLDVHEDFNDYLRAKMNIALHQQSDDTIIYHPTNSYSQQIAASSKARKKTPFLSPKGAYIKDSTVVINEQKICSVSDVGLIGSFNLENVCAAITAAWEFTQDVATTKSAVENFKGLEHRLEYVREINGVRFYNSSMSSTPGSALASITAFKKPEIIIMGGYDRNTDFSPLVHGIKNLTNIKRLHLIGQTRNTMAQMFKQAEVNNFEVISSESMEEIVASAYSYAVEGDIVLLSPACPSFDMFKNFSQRGDQFKSAVKGLK